MKALLVLPFLSLAAADSVKSELPRAAFRTCELVGEWHSVENSTKRGATIVFYQDRTGYYQTPGSGKAKFTYQLKERGAAMVVLDSKEKLVSVLDSSCTLSVRYQDGRIRKDVDVIVEFKFRKDA